jgi:D-inositol-3-phosphate glycosyltransferase
LRILYSFPHSLDRPGIALTARQQVLGLARLGVEVELFVTSAGSLRLPPGVRVHTTMSVRGVRLPHRAIGVQRAYDYHDAVVARWLARNGAGIDLVHAWPRGSLRTLRSARAAGIPALRESPNPHTASVIRQSERAAADAGVPLPPAHSHAANDAVLARERSEYAAASAVLVPSDYARDEFLAEGFPAATLLQHRYGCDLADFPCRVGPDAGADRAFRAVFVGRGDPTKGLHVALEAWRIADLPNAEFLIAGALQPDYAATLTDLLSLPSVTTLGFVTDVAALLRSADVLLLPTWTEGSALVTFEAAASGCVPLVSSAAGALGTHGADFLEHPVGDRSVLAAQLARLAADPGLLARLSAHASSRREFLSWDRAGEVLLERYGDAARLS